jgi:hypothetical protein
MREFEETLVLPFLGVCDRFLKAGSYSPTFTRMRNSVAREIEKYLHLSQHPIS